ncbi:MAG: hypothetical protein IJ817_02845 [Clostridia bacterium]|nr:hypothetical protein [Clostridia bacterium]
MLFSVENNQNKCCRWNTPDKNLPNTDVLCHVYVSNCNTQNQQQSST